MPRSYFQFKEFRINQDRCAMKVTTDACILGAWSQFPSHGNFIDIGTGTGLLALLLAQRSNGLIDAIELDENSFLQAKENVAASKWSARIGVIYGDVKKILPEKKYDFIICNPPFFASQLKSSSHKKNIARHDVSLNSTELLSVVKNLLRHPEGNFAVLLPYNQSEDFIAAAANEKIFLHQKLLIRDQAEKKIIRCVMNFAWISSSVIKTETLSIKDANGNYTKGFIKLMKPFYLYL